MTDKLNEAIEYAVTQENLSWMLNVLEQIVYTPEGKHIHESRLGPKFTEEIRAKLSEMKAQQYQEGE